MLVRSVDLEAPKMEDGEAEVEVVAVAELSWAGPL